MAKILKRTALVLVILFLAIQVIRPAKTNPQVPPERAIHAQMEVPAEVRAILERSCRDCHSAETRWPWYSHVAPVSWLVIDDVNDARNKMNLSDWAQYDTKKADEILGDICEQVSMNEMPLPSYRWMHRDAHLSAQEVRTLCEWTEREQEKLAKK